MSKGLSCALAFSEISQNCFCIGKVIDWVYGSSDNDYLLVYGGLAAMGQRGRFRAREFVMIDWREGEEERERRLFGFSPMAPVGGKAAVMATR
jgi:hypothetical protein